jgi:N-formylmaleamate deformylase
VEGALARVSGTSRYVDAAGLRLHLLEYGDAAPIVIAPGITSPAATWEFISLELARDHRVVVLDIRGRGLSDKPPSGFELSDYARDLAAVIDALGLERPVVLGHSMGARIAAALAVLHPGVAGPLVLVDPPLTGPGRDIYPMSLASFMDQLAKARAGATADDLRHYFPTLTDEQLTTRAEWLPTCDETAVRESWLNFHREDFFPYLEQLEPPVLFMYGGESPVVPAGALPELRAANDRVEMVAIPGAGHMIPWDNPDAFVAETRRFLKRLAAR